MSACWIGIGQVHNGAEQQPTTNKNNYKKNYETSKFNN